MEGKRGLPAVGAGIAERSEGGDAPALRGFRPLETSEDRAPAGSTDAGCGHPPSWQRISMGERRTIAVRVMAVQGMEGGAMQICQRQARAASLALMKRR